MTTFLILAALVVGCFMVLVVVALTQIDEKQKEIISKIERNLERDRDLERYVLAAHTSANLAYGICSEFLEKHPEMKGTIEMNMISTANYKPFN